MTEKDWADKKAIEIVGKWGYEEPYWWKPIARALRKARRLGHQDIWDIEIAEKIAISSKGRI